MDRVMSPYTDAHFAAALLSCGPHSWMDGCRDMSDMCNSPIHSRADIQYRDRVYKYFIKVSHITPSRIPNEWATFWREYIKWVKT